MARSKVISVFLLILFNDLSWSFTGYTICPDEELCFCSDDSDKIQIKCSNVTSLKPIQELLLRQFNDNRVNRLVIDEPCALTALPDKMFNTTISHFNSHCPLETIERDAFKGIKGLVSINIFGALFDKIPSGVSTFKKVRYLRIESFIFQSLGEELWKLSSLQNIHLRKGKLKELSKHCFVKSPRIQLIDFSTNNLEHIPPGTFDTLKSLRTLVLSNNKLTTVDGLFGSMNCNLKQLNLNINKLRSLTNAFPKDRWNLTALLIARNPIGCLNNSYLQRFGFLEHFNIQGTECDELDPDMLSSFPSLKTINLSFNEINNIPRDLFQQNKYLEKIFLQSNQLTNIQSIFRGLTRLKYLILKNNKIYYLTQAFEDLYSLDNLDIRDNTIKSIPRISFPKRNLVKKLWMNGNPLSCDCRLKWMINWLTRTKRKPLKDNPRCVFPHALRGKLLKEVTMNDLSSESLDLDNCPEPCQCKCDSRRVYYYLNLDCSNKNLSVVLPFWMPNLGAVDLSGNRLKDVRKIESILTEGVGSLNLERNQISNIDIDLPEVVNELRLSGNMLNRLPPILTKNYSFRVISLSGNPWICDCETKEMREWLLSKKSKIVDINETACGHIGPYPELYGKIIISLNETDLCPSSVKMGIIVGFGILGCLVSFTSVIIAYSRYHVHIKVYLYAHGITWVKEDDKDEDKIFDGFLSYSAEDENFAVDVIAKGLEDMEPKFELCIPDRDVLLGESVLPSMLQGAQLSKKIIIILSMNYMEDEFCKSVFREMFQQSLEDKVFRIILIKSENFSPNDDIDPDLKIVLESKACLAFGERLFWEKLRFAMPKKVRGKVLQNALGRGEHLKVTYGDNTEDDSDTATLLT